MRSALIIGFQYKDNKKLPGITVDLYQVYTFLRKNGWNEEEIRVMTDIEKDENTEILRVAILEKKVDANILSFIEDLGESHILFKSHRYYNNFNLLKDHIKKYNFIYYTGHFKDRNIVLPNNNYLFFENFIGSLLNGNNEFFIIMDCCEFVSPFPLVLYDKNFKLQNGDILDKIIKFGENKILCISASIEGEKAITSKTGSHFTNYLFEIQKIREQNFKSILLQLCSNHLPHTPNISSTYTNINYIPSWIFSLSLEINLFPYYLEIIKY